MDDVTIGDLKADTRTDVQRAYSDGYQAGTRWALDMRNWEPVARDMLLAAESQVSSLQQENERLQAEIADLTRRLGGGCESAGGGDHTAVRQGKYTFCGKCGESLRGVRYCHEPRPALQETGGSHE